MSVSKEFPIVAYDSLSAAEKAAVNRIFKRLLEGSTKKIRSVEICRIHAKALSVFITAARPDTTPETLFESTSTVHAFVGPRGGIRVASARHGSYTVPKKFLDNYS